MFTDCAISYVCVNIPAYFGVDNILILSTHYFHGRNGVTKSWTPMLFTALFFAM